MPWVHELAWFFGGAFLGNAVPHVVSGMLGRAFQSPFAKPSGRGLSSSTVNVVWGFFNLLLGYVLLCHVGDFDLRDTAHALAPGMGMLLMGVTMARYFGRFHGGHPPAAK